MLTRGLVLKLFPAMRPLSGLVLCCGLLSVPCAQADVWQELVAADRALAAKTAGGNLRAAFLEVLDENSIAFNPGPTSAREVWQARAEGRERLQWAPAQAEVSISGDLGYTLGPWQFTAAEPEPAKDENSDADAASGKDEDAAKAEPPPVRRPDAFGHFLNVWQRSPGGEWKLLLSQSIRHQEMALPTDAIRRGSLFAGSAPVWPVGVQELRKADLEPAGSVRPSLVSADFLRMRNGRPPDAVIESEGFEMRSPRRMETGLVISGAGDLAVTWGGGANSVRWLRIWRRPVAGDPPGLGWRLAVDLSQAANKPAE